MSDQVTTRQTMSEDALRKLLSKTRLYGEILEDAVQALAGKIAVQEGVGPIMDATDIKDAITDDLFRRYGGSWRNECGIDGILEVAGEVLAGKIPACYEAPTPLPSAGGLTPDRLTIAWLTEIGLLPSFVSMIYDRHYTDVLADRAATEARVRGEMMSDREAYEVEIQELRATIADLTAKLEDAFKRGEIVEFRRIGKAEWEQGFTAICRTETGKPIDNSIGMFEWRRPTPKTMTNEQKLEKVISSKAGSEPADREWAMRQVLSAWANGKSIDELYGEITP